MALTPGRHRTRSGRYVEVLASPRHPDMFEAEHPTARERARPMVYDAYGRNVRPGNPRWDIEGLCGPLAAHPPVSPPPPYEGAALDIEGRLDDDPEHRPVIAFALTARPMTPEERVIAAMEELAAE